MMRMLASRHREKEQEVGFVPVLVIASRQRWSRSNHDLVTRVAGLTMISLQMVRLCFLKQSSMHTVCQVMLVSSIRLSCIERGRRWQ